MRRSARYFVAGGGGETPDMKEKFPNTRAVVFLKALGVPFEGHLYQYRGPGGIAKSAAKETGFAEDAVFKTLVFASEGAPVIAIVDAAHRVSLSKLTDAVGAHRRVVECSPADAERLTGYHVGGISPFGLRRPIPVFLDARAMNLEFMHINGGSRGFAVTLRPADLVRILDATVADLAV